MTSIFAVLAASPQGGRSAAAKRRATGPPDAGKEADETSLQKIMVKTCSIMLQEQRNLDSKIGTVLLLRPTMDSHWLSRT